MAPAIYDSSAQIANYWFGICQPAGPSATPMHVHVKIFVTSYWSVRSDVIQKICLAYVKT